MNRTKRSIIAILIMILMVFAVIPEKRVFADKVTGGNINNKITWELDSDGTLTLEGEGDMPAFVGFNQSIPWLYYRETVTSIVVKEGITGLCSMAFFGCTHATQVILPDSLTTIGTESFLACASLKEIVIPNGVSLIKDQAFMACTSLSKVTLPDRKDLTIGEECFFACDLKSVTLNSESNLDPELFNAFSGIKFHYYYDVDYVGDNNGTITGETRTYGGEAVKLNINPKSGYYLARLGWYDANGSNGSLYADENGLYVMPDTEYPVTICATFSDQHYCGKNLYWEFDGISTLTIKGTGRMTDYSYSPWSNLNGLVENVVIEDGCTSIGRNAFRGLQIKSISIPSSVTLIDFGAFRACGALRNITIPEGVTSIGDFCFEGCGQLESIDLPDSLTYLGENCFFRCVRLTEITIPQNVTSIKLSAFEACDGLKKVVLPEGLTSIDNNAFDRDIRLQEINLPSTLTTLEAKAFEDCLELREVIIPDSITSLDNCFPGCQNLRKIVLPDNPDFEIPGHCFDSCIQPLTVVLNSESYINEYNFAYYRSTGALKYCYYYDVEYTCNDYGTVTGKTRSYCGDELELEIVPESDYEIDKVTMTYSKDHVKEILPDGDGKYKCEMPDSVEGVKIDVDFKIKQKQVIFCKQGENGETVELQNSSFDLMTAPVYNGPVPTREPNEIFSYTFIGWTDGENTYRPEETLPLVYDDVTYTAVFFEDMIKYEVNFLDEDGTVLQNGKAEYGTTPVYTGITPVKAEDDEFTYTFDGWTPKISEVTEDVTYTAVFKETLKEYEISFLDEDGTVLQNGKAEYGTTPVYTGITPVKAEDDKFTYTFDGWTPKISEVTGDAIYTAKYVSTLKVQKPEALFDSFVERIYEDILDRPSDPDGKSFWIPKVEGGELTGADCVRNFLMSDEFKERELTDEEFVTVLYDVLFDRDAASDPEGLKFWTESVKKVGRDAVVEGFINSSEWCDVCASYGIKSGAKTAKATVPSNNATLFATRLYTECLGREPDEEGLKFWSNGLTNLDLSGSQAAREFFYSAEFNSFNVSNKELITRMYKTFLGRDPEEEGMAFWMDSMDKGMTKDQLFDCFVDSKEFSDICIAYSIDR